MSRPCWFVYDLSFFDGYNFYVIVSLILLAESSFCQPFRFDQPHFSVVGTSLHGVLSSGVPLSSLHGGVRFTALHEYRVESVTIFV